MKKRHRSPARATRWLFASDHLTDEAFLRSLDGELTDREADEVDRHIQSCWSCRSRSQAFGQGIADLFEYQNAVTAPYLPPPTDQRAIFIARLNEVAEATSRPSRLRSMLLGMKRSLSVGEIARPAWIAAVLLVVVVPAVYFLRAPGTVSADEILGRAQASESAALLATTQPVVVQKIHIRAGGKFLVRTMYRDVKHHRVASRTDGSTAGESQVKVEYAKYALDWDSPLDAASYGRWRAAHPVSSDRVVRQGSDRLTLKTTYSAGAVAETDLTLRTSDYHAVRESLRLQDNSEIEIAELSYDVIPLNSVPVSIFSSPVLPGSVHPSMALLPKQNWPDSATLAAAEIAAEVALHRMGADLGEQIRVVEHPGQDVVVEGVVGDDERRQQLVAAMQAIPHTRLHLVTVDEAAQKSTTQQAAVPEVPQAASVQQMVATPPLLDAELNARFPDKDQRIAYVNQTLSLAQLASARAWALNRLADRQPVQEVAVLKEDQRGQLQVLLSDHISALREDVSSLQNQLGEILSRASNTPAANTAVQAPLESNASGAAESSVGWRDRIRRIHSSTEAIHESVVALLSSSQPHDQSDAAAIEVNLRTSLTQLQTELQALDQKVHETDLK